MEDENKMKWVDAMQDEMKSLYETHSFELVKLPKGKRDFEEQVGLQSEVRRTHFIAMLQSQIGCQRVQSKKRY